MPASVPSVGRIDLPAVLDELVAAASLPQVSSTEPVHGLGLDNLLLKAVLSDGRTVLLRQSKYQDEAPHLRAAFLAARDVGAPRLYAANERGGMLVDFVAGRLLADVVRVGAADDRTWYQVGSAYRRVHAVTFPAPLQGRVRPRSIELEPLDPVDQLLTKIAAAEPWLNRERPALLPMLAPLRELLAAVAAEMRAEHPCLTHGDANLHNVVVSDELATLIDWDFPAVRYPIDELSALDEHAYLNGASGLPPSFFAGYGRHVPRHLLHLYRIVGCLTWLSSQEWANWAADGSLPQATRTTLFGWRRKLLTWVDRLPEHMTNLGRSDPATANLRAGLPASELAG
jgi:hypothetical protein